MTAISAIYQFWNTYGSDIQNGAVVLSAIAAFMVIRDARSVARRRGTLKLVSTDATSHVIASIRLPCRQIT